MEKIGIALEDALVAALEKVDGLDGRVCPLVDIRKNRGPLAVYEQRRENEENEINGSSGLLEAGFQVHALHNSYKSMRLLAEQMKQAVKAMEGLNEKPLFVEAVEVEQSTPDLYEDKVELFRRTYDVKIYYQIKED